ncbi:MAG: IS30 family transposase [Erysipelotrichaceae bacterium]|nr:IS30 family transposase [Erysipelotrichaceae bacterium]
MALLPRKIQISNELKDRPEEANNRLRLGDWEGDTVAVAKGKACLVTYVDRRSRFLKCAKIRRKGSCHVKEATIKLLKNEPLCTIAPDRGKEFSSHAEITEELDQVQFYFPYPQHPWDRGTNENTNGLLREYFPKGMDITGIPEEYIQEKVDELNKRPRKCLGFKTPYEVYYSETLHLI